MQNNIFNKQFIDYPLIAVEKVESVLEGCEGSNQKKLLVVYQKDNATPEKMLNETHREFLKKILAAANYDIDSDILLLGTTPKEGFSFIPMRQIAANHPSVGEIDNLLVFGFSPKFLGLNIRCQKYEPVSFYGCGFLFADHLDDLEQNKQLKAALWNGMKSLFSI